MCGIDPPGDETEMWFLLGKRDNLDVLFEMKVLDGDLVENFLLYV